MEDLDATEAAPSDGATQPRRGGDALDRGDQLGRYVVLDRLGAGGMGVVYGGYDPELDRKVALKLLHPEGSGSGGTGTSGARTRLLREAQALARLDHPNVVSVHDVGTIAGQVYVAMDFVDGQTLASWLGEVPRPWRDVVAVMRDAGRGLAAAHEKGLVHRDFKPDNVMVGRDGRVRVMDFGLARARERTAAKTGPGDTETAETVGAAASDPLATDLTRQGAMLGTPRYMAPEQFLGTATDARTDVFSFCVTMWEALYGERPFAGETIAVLAASVTRGERREPPRGRAAPAWVRRVLDRGLETDPERRWPSMSPLLIALDRDPTGRRRAVVAVGAIAVAAGGAFGMSHITRERGIEACSAEGASIDQVWNAEVRERVRAVFVGSGLSYAETSFAGVAPWLDTYASEWSEARTLACRATEVERSRSPELESRAYACLDERRFSLESLVNVLVAADERALERAVEVSGKLRPVAECVDETALLREPLTPAPQREDIGLLRRDFSEVRTLLHLGKYERALAQAEPLLERAEALEWTPLLAEVQLVVGDLAEHTADFERAYTMTRTAFFSAVAANLDGLAADAAGELTYIVGYRLKRTHEGHTWGDLALVHLERNGEGDTTRRAAAVNAIAAAHFTSGEYEKARELWAESARIKEASQGKNHPDLADTLNNLATVHQVLGEDKEAETVYRRALQLREASLGAQHPLVAVSLSNLANVLKKEGKYAEAIKMHGRALAIREAALGPEHPQVASSANNLANVHDAIGNQDAALALHTRALAIYEASGDANSPEVAMSLNNLATLHTDLGDPKLALHMYERALAIHERTSGPDHPLVAMILNNMANTHEKLGEVDVAIEKYGRARELWVAALGDDHPRLAYPDAGLGRAHLTKGRPETALPYLERAAAVWGPTGAAPGDVGDVRFGLARALWATGEQARARTLAADAIESYGSAGAPATSRREEARAWLKERETTGK